jgi:prepilin-type N-terminal cleavage/methylation domain-containing protein
MNRKGFTLIELLIVVAIIGILAAVGAAVIPKILEIVKVNTVKHNHKNTAEFIIREMIHCQTTGEIATYWSSKAAAQGHGRTNEGLDLVPCELKSSDPLAANFGIIARVLIYSEMNGPNPFNSGGYDSANRRTTGTFRMENYPPPVSEIGRTHCNIVNTYATKKKQNRIDQKVHCYSRWGTGANDYETTIIASPF